ncbi:MAG TPA: hypothetical protein PKD76_01140 [Solirubrobacterales bacterium]|nr:hypothetical protein [Solirubrobacterales bacterium]
MIGTRLRKSDLRWAGRPTLGFSEATAPGRIVEVSGEINTATAAAASMPSRMMKTSEVGQGANWISKPQASAPTASPASGATPFTTPLRRGCSGGWRSTITALNVARAAPVASP